MAEDILGFSKAIDTEGIDNLSNEQVDMILKMFEKAGY
jgi:hypothetical protein